MFLSHLLIDAGENPDRPRPGRLWLRNMYRVHQRLAMAFPSPERREADPHLLRPYAPEDFPEQRHMADRGLNAVGRQALDRAHAPRNDESGFLFRIDPLAGGRVVILVVSALKPDWDYAFQNARILLAAPPDTREYDPSFSRNEILRFRIRVNLAKKTKRSTDGADLRRLREGTDKSGRQKDQSKRVALTWKDNNTPDEAVRAWFAAKVAQKGFDLRDFHLVRLGWVAGYRPNARPGEKASENGRKMKFRSALIEGTLVVTDADAFRETLAKGIGSAKAFGFGLLSVARVNTG